MLSKLVSLVVLVSAITCSPVKFVFDVVNDNIESASRAEKSLVNTFPFNSVKKEENYQSLMPFRFVRSINVHLKINNLKDNNLIPVYDVNVNNAEWRC